MPDVRRVRVTMLPDPIEVPADEIPVLRAQGLLVEDDARPTVAVSTTKTVKKEGSA